MLRRLAATALAGALVLVPPAGAGLDVVNQHHASAAGAGMSRRTLTRSVRGVRPAIEAPTEAARFAAGEVADEDDVAALEVAAFGFGPHTGFFPTDQPRELVLSFDDGPDLKFTPLVLDELDRRGLKAIFFVTGDRVIGDRPEDLARRELLGRIAAHGHMVANHTMTHRHLCQPKADAVVDVGAEIDETAEVIAQATGVRPLLFRAPYGARCRKLEAALVARQLVSVGWNLDPQDWRNPTSEGILTYLQSRLSRLQGRGILLLHDTHPASVFALGPLLDWIARENRVAVRTGRPPIVLRDYSVFLPARPVPRTGIVTVANALFDTMTNTVLAAVAPRAGLHSPISPR
ncbi:MAG: polysaccharide deacetylase family protein [Bacteroidota bacterium]